MKSLKRFFIKLQLTIFAFFVLMMASFTFVGEMQTMVFIFFICAMCTLGWLVFYLTLFRIIEKVTS